MSRPTEIIIQKAGAGGFTGEYIVSLKDDESRSAVLAKLGNEASTVAHQWSTEKHGFSGAFNDSALSILKTLSPEVTSIVEDTYLQPAAIVEQEPINSAPWGLERLSSAAGLVGRNPKYSIDFDSDAVYENLIYLCPTSLLNFAYRYNDHVEYDGNVDIYVLVDTPVDTGPEFTAGMELGSRKGFFFDFLFYYLTLHDYSSIIGSNAYGVTKNATCRLIDIKVSPGGIIAIINALEYVRDRALATMNPSVVNYSLLALLGSNFGASVDIFAHGVTITGARPGAVGGVPNRTTASGTSGAAPHVAGLVAYLLKFEGPRTPQEMKDRIRVLARPTLCWLIGVITVVAGIVDTTRDLASNGL
ncbi:hypothetical protein F5887DRAFT_1075422 [Amanita rubescens]|nr:hypothetical protein F5887DRAFT_1075422 [Amanita rubescens]